MARITFRYKFEVESYKLQGLKLLNVNRTIRLTNPDLNTSSDSYATLERDTFGTPDPNGFYSSTWYVAQNCQGTVESILSESQRYYKKVNNVATGAAPPLGMQIEAWAYSTATTATDEYAIYQMYVGKNNTNNFDVEPNHFYNLRTTIDADINSAKNDERIRAYIASQYVEFHASKNVTTSGGASFDDTYTGASINYDLDAAYDVRPIVIQTQGRTVEVGIYTDADCTQQATAHDSWLRLSSSSNYTEAYNNVKEPLDTHIKASVILPTQVKFYLYNDEYLYDSSGNLLDPGRKDTEGKRSLYIKVTTTTNGDGGLLQASHIFKMDQRPAVYTGPFGGGKNADGNYTMGLVHDRFSVRAMKYLKDLTLGSIQYGYDNVETAKNSYGTDDMNYGKYATVNLAENINNLTWTGNIPVPRKDASGHVLLYQYQYPVSTFSARACYDKNRDEDGNGRIEGDEIKWYLPASNQLIALQVGSTLNYFNNGGATTEDESDRVKRWYSGINSYNKHQSGSSRCVRDIPLGNSQITGIYTDANGNKYAAIYSTGLPESRVENRSENADFYTRIKLYTYTPNGQDAEVIIENGDTVYVNRVKRHKIAGTQEQKVSKTFIVSPDIVNSDGKSLAEAMNWATANGYLATANSNEDNIASYAVSKGCAMYRGKNGQDEPGTWRVPTLREGSLIMIFYKELEATNAETGFKAFALSNTSGTSYWLATEYSTSNAWYMQFYPDATKVKYTSSTSYKRDKYYLRCIRDIPSE